MLQPDLFVYRTATGGPLRDWSDITALPLVFEVTSSATARCDRNLNHLRYQRAGVPEYWVVDPEARSVERWRPSEERPAVVLDRLAWNPPGAATASGMDLPALVDEAGGGG